MNIQAVKYSTRLEDFVVLRYGVILKRKSTSIYVGLCPLHSESTPSFHVCSDKQKYHCFGCGAHGDIFDLVQAKESVSFSEATEILGAGSTHISKEAIRQQRELQLSAGHGCRCTLPWLACGNPGINQVTLHTSSRLSRISNRLHKKTPTMRLAKLGCH